MPEERQQVHAQLVLVGGQWAPDEPDLDFRTGSSSIVIQMNRKPGEIGADTVTVTNATKKKGATSVTMGSGSWYADVQADHSWAIRFTPVS
jgi:nitrogen fixation protein FixH